MQMKTIPSLILAAAASGSVNGATPMRASITGVSHIAVYASDSARAEHFYVHDLGATRGPDPENRLGARYYFSVIASPLRSRFAISPSCLPLNSRIAPFWLVSTMPRTPAPNATPAPAAA